MVTQETRDLAGILIGVVLGVLLLGAIYIVRTPIEQPVTVEHDCQKDEACWDCLTMGNLICGPSHSHPNQGKTI
jgi:hypothetical protein